MSGDLPRGGFGLYVHWPYCLSKCPYCDFNSHVAASIDHDRFCAAYTAEIARIARAMPGRVLSTIYFGGGTPSLMDPRTVEAVLDAARRAWPTTNDVEITLEANPTSVEAGNFSAYRLAGVNRVSLGVQALDDRDLQRLGRTHDVAEALRAFDIARNTFDRVSFDLIYARQDQSLKMWEAELKQALSLAFDHLSLYQLTVEEGTVFARRAAAGSLSGLPDEDRAADMFEITQELTTAHGLPAYEVSNHARPGAESRHNLIYWTAGEYAGVGPGAHGRRNQDGRRVATEAIHAPQKWLEAVDSAGSGDLPAEILEPTEALEEYFMMGLRLADGVRLSDMPTVLNQAVYINKINELVSDGLLDNVGGTLSTSARGRPLLNGILRALLTG